MVKNGLGGKHKCIRKKKIIKLRQEFYNFSIIQTIIFYFTLEFALGLFNVGPTTK
jgi:hypothetical protein